MVAMEVMKPAFTDEKFLFRSFLLSVSKQRWSKTGIYLTGYLVINTWESSVPLSLGPEEEKEVEVAKDDDQVVADDQEVVQEQQLVQLQGGLVVGEGVEAGVVQHKGVVAIPHKEQDAVCDVDSKENLGINVQLDV